MCTLRYVSRNMHPSGIERQYLRKYAYKKSIFFELHTQDLLPTVFELLVLKHMPANPATVDTRPFSEARRVAR